MTTDSGRTSPIVQQPQIEEELPEDGVKARSKSISEQLQQVKSINSRTKFVLTNFDPFLVYFNLFFII